MNAKLYDLESQVRMSHRLELLLGSFSKLWQIQAAWGKYKELIIFLPSNSTQTKKIRGNTYSLISYPSKECSRGYDKHKIVIILSTHSIDRQLARSLSELTVSPFVSVYYKICKTRRCKTKYPIMTTISTLHLYASANQSGYSLHPCLSSMSSLHHFILRHFVKLLK